MEHLSEIALDRLVDGDLVEEERTTARAHLAACGGCRDAYQRTTRMLHAAGSLPSSVEPPRDLWPGIAAGIEAVRSGRNAGEAAGGVNSGRRDASSGPRHAQRDSWIGAGRRSPWRMRHGMAAAAAGILVFSAIFTWSALDRAGRAGPDGRAGPVPAASPAGERVVILAARAMEAEYDSVVADLLATLRMHGESLSSETRSTIDRNLEIIDAALAEIRAALEAEPSSRELPHALAGAYRMKVDVLQDALKAARHPVNGREATS